MRTRLPRVCSRVFTDVVHLLPLIVGAALGLPVIAANESDGDRLNISMRARAPIASAERDFPIGQSAHSGVSLEVLEVRGRRAMSERASFAAKLNLARDFDCESCRDQFAYPVSEGRCESRLLGEVKAIHSSAAGLRLEFGLLEIPQSGWASYSDPAENPLPEIDPYAPFDKSQPGFALAGDVPGHGLTLVVTNDTTTKFPGRGEFTNRQTQPTWIVEWRARDCSLCYLFQLGNYDLNHSQFLAVGLKYHAGGISEMLDVKMDLRDRKYLDRSRRSARWSARSQTSAIFMSSHEVKLVLDFFRVEAKGLKGDEQLANAVGQMDQNRGQAAFAYLWQPSEAGLRYFVDVKAVSGRFYSSSTRSSRSFGYRAESGIGVISLW